MSVQSKRFAAGCVSPLHATFDKSLPSLRLSKHSLTDIDLPSSLSPFSEPQDKFTQLLNLLPDLKVMAQRGEDFLYFKHMQASIAVSTIITCY